MTNIDWQRIVLKIKSLLSHIGNPLVLENLRHWDIVIQLFVKVKVWKLGQFSFLDMSEFGGQSEWRAVYGLEGIPEEAGEGTSEKWASDENPEEVVLPNVESVVRGLNCTRESEPGSNGWVGSWVVGQWVSDKEDIPHGKSFNDDVQDFAAWECCRSVSEIKSYKTEQESSEKFVEKGMNFIISLFRSTSFLGGQVHENVINSVISYGN